MSSQKIIIGTRGSDLALWQANYTKFLLEEKGYEAELKIISTHGDRTQQWNTSFDKLEGKGFFTKELEDELLAGTIDVAVHSHKDLPTTNPDGLMIAAVSQRENPAEWLLMRKEALDEKKRFQLKEGAHVGTSSARRKSQLLAFRPDVQITDLRGNVPTRVKKLREGQYDAILLAAAGLERLELDLSDLHVEELDPREFIPAPAQGVLAWQIRETDNRMLDIFDTINDFDVLIKINIERRILNLFDGGCQLPLGAYCETEFNDDDRKVFKVYTSVADAWDKQPRQMYFETINTEDFADSIVSRIQSVTPKKVFVSRDLREKDYLYRALARLDFTVQSKSLIDIKQITIKEALPKTDWIFFSSKHGVKYFFNQKPDIGQAKIGCVGKSTAQELRQYGYRADFIGQSTDTKLVGKQFAAKIGGGAKVLFPVARESMQSIQYQIAKKENVFNVVVYATLKQSIAVDEDVQILVFTSPSNVDAFYEKNTIANSQQVVAIGDATESALLKKGVKEDRILKPEAFDDLAMFRAILHLSGHGGI